MNTGSRRLHRLVAVFILACSLFARACRDAHQQEPEEKSTVKIQISGAKLASEGYRLDWGQNSSTDKYPVIREPITGLSNSFSVTVPPYSITNIVIPTVATK